MTDTGTGNPSAHRLRPATHLAHAAAADLGSQAERYHLAAASAEALNDIGKALRDIAKAIGS